jgi:uncharacterized membrane protein
MPSNSLAPERSLSAASDQRETGPVPTTLPASGGTSGNAILRAALIAVILAGIFFRFYHLDGKVYWEDEIFGTIHALGYTEAQIVRDAPQMHTAADLQQFFHEPAGGSKPLSDTVASLAAEDPQHPPLYYLLGHLWMERFGSSVAAIRSLSAIFGLLALPCAYFLALELFGSTTLALITVALLAVSPFHVLYAQEAREYSLWTVAILLNALALLRALRLRTPVAWAIYGTTLVASVFVYPLSGLIAVGGAAYIFAIAGSARPKALIWFGACVAIAALAFLPWLSIMVHSAGLGRGMSGILGAKLSPAAIVLAFIRGIRGIFFDLGAFRFGPLRSTPINLALLIATTALAAYAMLRLFRGAPRNAAAFITLALCCPILPLVARDLISGGRLVYQGRYFTPLYLGLELAVAYLVYADLFDRPLPILRKRLTASVFVALLGGGIASCAISSQAGTWWNKDYEQSRDVAGVVDRSPNPLVVSDQGTSRMLGLGYYLDPRVALRVHMSCEQCSLPVEPSGALLSDAGSFSDVFLLGPSDGLAREAATRGGSATPRYQTIGVGIYSGPQTSLNLFLPS